MVRRCCILGPAVGSPSECRRPGLLAAAGDEIRTCGSSGKNRVFARNFAWQSRRKPLHNGQGVPALVCRRAFARFKENMAVRTFFLLGILRDFSERNRTQSRNFFWAPGRSGGFRTSILSETAGAGFRLNGLHRRGRPFWGPRAPRPVGTSKAERGVCRAGGQDLRSAVLPAFVPRQAGIAGRNGRFPEMNRGRQPERACSGSSG
jgi:hypothetical protein